MTSTEITSASKIMMGTTEASAMYIGSTSVWESSKYDCRVEYIESTGTQLIDTLYKPSPNTSFDSTMLFVANSNKNVSNVNVTFLGTSNEESGYYLGFNFGGRADLYREIFFWANKTYASGGAAISKIFNESDITSKFQFHYQSGSVTMANQSITPQTATHTFTTETLTLFGGRNTTFNRWNLRIYAFKIYDNGVLIRDFIPVKKNNVGYLYDKISERLFGNAGSGSFILGPDIVEIEYLQSSGSQYIETGIIPDANTGMYLKGSQTGNNDNYAAGLRNDSSNTRWCIGRSGYGWYWGYGTYDNTQNSHLSKDANIVECKLNYLNDSKWSGIGDNNTSTELTLSTLSFTPSYNIRLFGSAGVSAGYSTYAGKIYAVKISQGTNVVMDLIPVRVNLTGYMYDKISGQLFGNSGSGTFTLGPDKQ